MYRHLLKAAGATPVELEVSVDETDTPTSPAEHYYVACELKRLGVEWVSLAPRFVGRFEKGVDYIGDLGELRADVRRPRRASPATSAPTSSACTPAPTSSASTRSPARLARAWST